jgi:biopolymer transport protein ExbD
MASGGGNADGDVGFQIAPMIDLILVLLVFFMSTVALKQVETELGIGLPGKSLANTEAKLSVDMNIGIEADGSVTLNADPVGDAKDKDLQKLRDKLMEQIGLFDDKIPITICPQPDVVHSRVIDVLNACVGAKVKNITFGG